MSISFKDIRLDGIESELINNFDELDGEYWGNITDYYKDIDKKLLNDFNKRIILPENINRVLSLCDYLLIKNTLQFVMFNSYPSFIYVLDEHHSENYELPLCMTQKYHIESAVANGLVDYIEFYKEIGVLKNFEKSKRMYDTAIQFNQFETFVWLNKHGYSWNKTIMDKCARLGRFNFIQYAYLNGCTKYTKYTISEASEGGHIEILKWLHEKGIAWGPLDGYLVCLNATQNGHLDCLKYAHKKGCSINSDLFGGLCSVASEYGHIECLKYLCENGCVLGDVLQTCAKYGRFDCLKIAYENGGQWNKKVCEIACIKGHIDCLKYAYENGCPIDIKECIKKSKKYGIFEHYKHCVHFLNGLGANKSK